MRTKFRRRYATRSYLRVMGQEPTPTDGITVPATPSENPAPVDPAVDDPTPTPDPTSDPKLFDETYVKGLRTENANHRIKNRELLDQLEAYQRKERTDFENLQADLDKYKGDMTGLKRENQKLVVQVAAAKLGIVDPDAAAQLLDWSAIDGGAPVEEALATLLETRPWLKKVEAATPAPTTPTTPTTPPAPTTPANPANPEHEGKKRYTKSELDRLTIKETAAQLDDIQYAMANGLIDMTK